jgi:CubicO group peptidase (beta-lactamase class C family)
MDGAWIDGSLHPAFTPVADALRRQLRRYPGGAAVCVWHEGECVADLWGGARDASGKPWTRNTLSPSFSTTKGVATTLVHILVDRGLLRYDDRVAKYWPEFAQNGKERITLRQVLAHQSGLYHIRQMIDHADRMLDWEYMIRAIERTRPIHEPGTHTGYHGLTYGFLVGEILQRVTGKRFAQLVRDEIAKPLKLDGLYVGAPPEALARAAQLLWPGHLARLSVPDHGLAGLAWKSWAAAVRRLFGALGVSLDLRSLLDALAPRGISSFQFDAAHTLRVSIPAANGLFTARSLAKLYATLAAGGTLGGVQLLSRDTLAHATQIVDPTPGRVVIPFDMRWRLGWHAAFTTHGVLRQGFGHFGFGGSGAWADPYRNLAVALIVNGGIGTPFGDLRIARMGAAAIDSVRQRPRVQRASAPAARLRAVPGGRRPRSPEPHPRSRQPSPRRPSPPPPGAPRHATT